MEAGWDQITEFVTDTLSRMLSNHHRKLLEAGMSRNIVDALTLNMQEAWLSQFFVKGYAPDPTYDPDDDEDEEDVDVSC